jgi:hypothetical protein
VPTRAKSQPFEKHLPGLEYHGVFKKAELYLHIRALTGAPFLAALLTAWAALLWHRCSNQSFLQLKAALRVVSGGKV